MSQKQSTSKQASKPGSGQATPPPASLAAATETTETRFANTIERSSMMSSSNFFGPSKKILVFDLDVKEKWKDAWVRFSNVLLLALLVGTLVLTAIYVFVIRRTYPTTIIVPATFTLVDEGHEANVTNVTSSFEAEHLEEVPEWIPHVGTSLKPELLPENNPDEDLKLEADSEKTTETPFIEW